MGDGTNESTLCLYTNMMSRNEAASKMHVFSEARLTLDKNDKEGETLLLVKNSMIECMTE